MPISPAVSESSDVALNAIPIRVCEKRIDTNTVRAAAVRNTIRGNAPTEIPPPTGMLSVPRAPIWNERESE